MQPCPRVLEVCPLWLWQNSYDMMLDNDHHKDNSYNNNALRNEADIDNDNAESAGVSQEKEESTG